MAIHSDLSVRVHVRCDALDWTPSPVSGVQRKRLHHTGAEESGQVTSLVRFLPGTRFPEHPHPGGEEILVIDGTFSDAGGDYTAPAHLLNPEGFSHAPWSDPGCLLFVKLRQYSGRERLAINTGDAHWDDGPAEGVRGLDLQAPDAAGTATRLLRLEPGAALPSTCYPGGAEYFVLEGGFEDQLGSFATRDWLRLPPGAEHAPRSRRGALLYVKMNAVVMLDHED